jgi:hypothetical protein
MLSLNAFKMNLVHLNSTRHFFIVGLCEGDCDSDAECAPGLKCMQRTGDEAVPGCSGPGNPGEDYCIDPNSILN